MDKTLNQWKDSQRRVALYARVSTTNHDQDPELQLRDMRVSAKLRGQRVVEEYVDRITSAKISRPALDCLMADAERHKFDAVMVWKFDRFARSAIHLNTALEKFKALGITFVSKTEDIDTSTPAGKMVFTILGAVAEMERDMIRERVSAGLRNRRAQGKHIGPPGAKVITQKIFDKAHALRKKGLTYRDIGKQLDITAMTAWKLVKRDTL